MRSKRSRRRLFAFIASTTTLAAGITTAWCVHSRLVLSAAEAQTLGMSAHQSAWVASFKERGLVVPDRPREGWWCGEWKPVPDVELGWILPPSNRPGFYQIDADGLQHAPGAGPTILVTGGSVASGACASRLDATWFSQLARRLDRKIVVAAAVAWDSGQEVAALRRFLPRVRPKTALMLTGLNDITHPIPERDKVHSDETRQARFIRNIKAAALLAEAAEVELVVVLQPLIAEKYRTAVEAEFVRNESNVGKSMQDAYAFFRQALADLARQGKLRFLDMSRVFVGEPTTFVDVWHFSDPGHAILSEALATNLLEASSHGRTRQ